MVVLALGREARQPAVAQRQDLVLSTLNQPQLIDHPALAGHVVALAGCLALTPVKRPEIVAAEQLPRVVDEALLEPVVRCLTRPEAVGQAKPANFGDAIQSDDFEKRRSVRHL